MSAHRTEQDEAGIDMSADEGWPAAPPARRVGAPLLRPLPPPDLGVARPELPRHDRLADVARPSWARAEVVVRCADALAAMGGASLPSIGVTSCAAGEGRSTIAAAFAVVQRCSYGRRTVLVELDLERPSLAGTLGLFPGPGVAEVLRGEASIDECLQWPLPDLGVMVAGDVGDACDALLAQVASGGLLPGLRAVSDVVVTDLPTLTSDVATRMAPLHREVVLVVKAGAVPLPQLKRTVASLDTPPSVVLNQYVPLKPAWLDGMLGDGR